MCVAEKWHFFLVGRTADRSPVCVEAESAKYVIGVVDEKCKIDDFLSATKFDHCVAVVQ
jgi:hypothetical protein